MADDDLNDPARWDRLAADYAQMAAPFTGLFAQAALAQLPIGAGTRVLDVATGTGVAALLAAERGADVVAIDFAEGMVRHVASHGLPNVIARQMDGQALDLPDASFDVTVSIFGVVLFPDWRKGLAEMARVTRSGGIAAVVTWREADGAAVNLLLGHVRRQLFPELTVPPGPAGLAALGSPQTLGEAMIAAGFQQPDVVATTHDFNLDLAMLDDADRLFALAPAFGALTPDQRAQAVAEIKRTAGVQGFSDTLPIPSTALIATGRRA